MQTINNLPTNEDNMSLILTLNAFFLFLLCVKIERLIHIQLTLDNDDLKFNDWEFERN